MLSEQENALRRTKNDRQFSAVYDFERGGHICKRRAQRYDAATSSVESEHADHPFFAVGSHYPDQPIVVAIEVCLFDEAGEAAHRAVDLRVGAPIEGLLARRDCHIWNRTRVQIGHE